MNNLHLSPEAQADLAAIKAYIAADLENPSAALATVTRITKTIRLLREHAYIGTPLSAIANVSGEHRYLVSGNHMIFYRVQGSFATDANTTVEVLPTCQGADHPPKWPAVRYGDVACSSRRSMCLMPT